MIARAIILTLALGLVAGGPATAADTGFDLALDSTLSLGTLWANVGAGSADDSVEWTEDTAVASETPAEAPAPGRPFQVKNGFFISAFLPLVNMEGDLDGTQVYDGFFEAVLVPDADDGIGFGIGLGGRADYVSFEMNYQLTWHDWTHVAQPAVGVDDTMLNVVNFDFKIYPLPWARIQPTILLGFGFPWMDVEGGSVSATAIGDVTYFGIAGQVGGGLTIYPLEQLGIFALAGYRGMYFFDAWGEIVSGELSDGFDASGWFAQFGTTFTF